MPHIERLFARRADSFGGILFEVRAAHRPFAPETVAVRSAFHPCKRFSQFSKPVVTLEREEDVDVPIGYLPAGKRIRRPLKIVIELEVLEQIGKDDAPHSEIARCHLVLPLVPWNQML